MKLMNKILKINQNLSSSNIRRMTNVLYNHINTKKEFKTCEQALQKQDYSLKFLKKKKFSDKKLNLV